MCWFITWVARDEIDPKMVRGLNLNLEEQALPAGKQCVGTSVTGLRHDKKVTSASIWYIWHLLRQVFPPLMSFAQRQKRSLARNHVFFNVGLVLPDLKATISSALQLQGQEDTLILDHPPILWWKNYHPCICSKCTQRSVCCWNREGRLSSHISHSGK